MTDSEKVKPTWVRRYADRFVSITRFKCFNRRQQQAYLDMRENQLKQITKRFDCEENAKLSPMEKKSNANLFTKTKRELKSKWMVFNDLDRLWNDERVWLQVGHKHRHQTTLDQWVVALVKERPPKRL